MFFFYQLSVLGSPRILSNALMHLTGNKLSWSWSSMQWMAGQTIRKPLAVVSYTHQIPGHTHHCYHQSVMEKPWNDATLLRRSIDTDTAPAQAPPSVDLNIGSLLSWAWVTTHTALSGVNNWDSLWNTGHLLPLVSSSCVLTWPRVANNVWNLSQTIFLNVTIDWSFMALISSALFVWCILVESENMDLG